MLKAKDHGYCQKTLTQLETAMETRYAIEREKGSTAERFDVSAKGIEVRIRHHVQTRGISSKADFRARSEGKADGYLFINGKRYPYDVKTGGTVGKPQQDGSWDESDILPSAPYVIFPVIDIIETDDDILDESVIFTREAWLELCASCSRKGLAGTFHVTGKTPVIAFQPTPLNKLRRMIEKMLNNGDGWVLRDYEAT